MSTVTERLQALQQSMDQRNEPDWADEDTEKLFFTQSRGLFHVEYYGSPFDEVYEEFLHVICERDVALQLRSLVFRGPDEGANGTRNWDLTKMIETDVEFPRMNSFFIEPTAPEDHNQSIVGAVYDEEGQIGRLLAKCPALKSLTVPSAPDAGFFRAGPRPLSFLRVDSGYDHQDFVSNLSRSACFPQLRMLDFGDYNQRSVKGYQENCTPFEDYAQLFRSAPFAGVGRFNLRNASLSPEQLTHLRGLREDLQFFTIGAQGDYVR